MSPEIKSYLELVVKNYETTIKRRSAVKHAKCVRYNNDPLVSWERNLLECAKQLLKSP